MRLVPAPAGTAATTSASHEYFRIVRIAVMGIKLLLGGAPPTVPVRVSQSVPGLQGSVGARDQGSGIRCQGSKDDEERCQQDRRRRPDRGRRQGRTRGG